MTLPNLSNAVKAYMQPITFQLVNKQIVDFNVVETYTTIKTRGVRQPYRPQSLDIQNKGQRAWKWECIHFLPGIDLKNDDIIIFKNNRYRVMDSFDCSEYGYVEVLIAQTFEDKNETP